ncbi:MAG: TIGR04002 family protein [Oscillospiraceae bacterium]|nr:TIGR04002 family protein [Oscillospiraceae bacterium]
MNKTIKLLTLSAMFTALTIVLTTFGKIPIGNGYIHTGDSVIYLASCILPFPYAVFTAAVGGALSDALGGYFIYILPTLIIKALITLPYSSKSETILTKRNAMMIIPAGAVTIIGYFITGLLLFGWSGAVIGLLGDTIQAVGSAVVFLIFAAALDKAKFKQNIKIMMLT